MPCKIVSMNHRTSAYVPMPKTYRNLLEHLIDVGENGAVQIPVIVHGKAVSEAALRHLNDGVLDGVELALDLRVIFRKI